MIAMKYVLYSIFLLSVIFFNCSKDDGTINSNIDDNPDTTSTIKLLSLGDSYTIGQSVCTSCRFPEQLKDSLKKIQTQYDFSLEIIATTGWTTTDLKNAIADSNLNNDFDLVTLLIGVNNQYQGKPFSLYENEFPELVSTAITLAKGDANRLIVVSIPDYAYTPFGQGNSEISEEIDIYNAFARNYCNSNGITFIDITDITRLGLEQPQLVASDGLHPSELAYSKFVERLLPAALQKLQ